MRLICFIIACFFLCQGLAQEHMTFHHLTTRDGLSSNSIRCLYQDSKGFIWIGTDGGGLNRFDGYRFTVFNYQDGNPQSISNNQIFAIIEDHQGFLWVATNNGLNRYDPKTGLFKRFYHDPRHPQSLKHNKTTSLLEDSENTLWVGTVMGLHKYLPASESFVHYYEKMTTHDLRPDREINAIAEDKNGNLWLGTWWGGLKKFNKKNEQFTDFYSDPANVNSLRNNNVMSLFLDHNNVLWIGNYMGGIRKLNTLSEKFLPINDPEKDANIMGLCCDKSGRIWYSRSGIGILQPQMPSFQLIDYKKTKSSGINSGIYFPVMCDKTGILWLGSEQGLSMYDPRREKFMSFYKSVKNDHYQIKKFYYNKEQQVLWLGTLKNGLIKLDEKSGQVTNFRPDPSMSNRYSEIQTLYGNTKDQLWIGTNNGIGIMDMKTERIISTLYNNPYKPSLVNRVYGDNEFMWLSNDNVRIIDVQKQKEYKFPTSGPLSLPCQQITAVVNDNDKYLWIGTFDGLAKYNCTTREIVNYGNELADSTSLSDKYILSVFQDSRKNIWIGTQNGLNRYHANKDNFERITRHSSFTSNYILNIQEDNHHNLWLFTDKGITKYNPDNGQTRNYDENDGLDFGGQVYKGKDGIFYCNSKNEDFYAFHPDSIKDNTIVPPVYITKFLLFNKEVPVSDKTKKTPLSSHISETTEITLKHNQSYMSFEFVALNYTLPNKNQYAYQMEGFDNDWYYTDASHLSATYTNLNPGSYIFRVKASNNDGIWNEKGTAIKITILPPFWKTRWAYLIYFFIIAGLVFLFRSYLLHQYRLKTMIEIERIKAEKTHEMDQMKLDFFGNISHEFRTPLTLIAGPLDYFFERQSELNWINDHKYFLIMKRNVDRLLQLINKVLDIRKLDAGFLNIHLKNDNIIQFVKSLTESFVYKAEQKDIQYTRVFHQTEHYTLFDPDLMEKIVFNLLSNAFKFTPEHGKICFEMIIFAKGTQQWENESHLDHTKVTSDLVKLIVKDNGIGISHEQRERIFERFYQVENQISRSEGSGIGLTLVKELVKLAKGKIELESELDQGTCFTIWLPLDEEIKEQETIDSSDIPTNTITLAKNGIALQNDKPLERVTVNTEESNQRPLILIIEDNHDMGLYISGILNDSFDIVTASNGKSGFEYAMEYIPDLIVSDIMMPGMDGLEMCQLIKNNERTNHIPIILLTARSTEEYQIQGLFAGADDYIMKPFTAKNLQLRIGNIIKARQLLREKFSLSDAISLSGKVSSMDDAFVNKMSVLVEKHLDNPDLDPQLFATELGMSRAQLYRKIKAITNQTVNDFIFSIKINMAKKLLSTENLSISEVAYRVGFKTPAHFSKVFSTHVGMSPSKYTEKYKIK